MLFALLALLCLVGVGAVEALMLSRIVNHPAGGYASGEDTLVSMLMWASVPLLGAAALVVVCLLRNSRVPLRPLVIVCVVGPLLSLIALRQYGHATPGFLFLGFIAQCLAVVAGWWRVRGAT